MRFFPRWRTTRWLLERILSQQETMMATLDELSASFAVYAGKVDAYIAAMEAFKTTVDEQIARAIEADDADEAVDLQALKGRVDAAAEKVPPVPPVFESSNQ